MKTLPYGGRHVENDDVSELSLIEATEKVRLPSQPLEDVYSTECSTRHMIMGSKPRRTDIS